MLDNLRTTHLIRLSICNNNAFLGLYGNGIKQLQVVVLNIKTNKLRKQTMDNIPERAQHRTSDDSFH